MKIRFVTAEDNKALLNIYAQYIDTAITFEYSLPTEAEFLHRVKNISKDYPYLVAEDKGKIIGYAYAHKYKERAAYQWGAELSIYMDKTYTTKGIGKKLYSILIEILKLQGVKTVYGFVTSPNIKSERLHNILGFQNIGMHHNTGYKCGKWQNVQCFEKSLANYDDNPLPVLSISEISEEQVKLIIDRTTKE